LALLFSCKDFLSIAIDGDRGYISAGKRKTVSDYVKKHRINTGREE
jgi:hypothetical protein